MPPQFLGNPFEREEDWDSDLDIRDEEWITLPNNMMLDGRDVQNLFVDMTESDSIIDFEVMSTIYDDNEDNDDEYQADDDDYDSDEEYNPDDEDYEEIENILDTAFELNSSPDLSDHSYYGFDDDDDEDDDDEYYNAGYYVFPGDDESQSNNSSKTNTESSSNNPPLDANGEAD